MRNWRARLTSFQRRFGKRAFRRMRSSGGKRRRLHKEPEQKGTDHVTQLEDGIVEAVIRWASGAGIWGS
jgi:hypothetical protein